MTDRWTPADAPPQRGRVFVVTGANSGLGLETARALAKLGATVVMACRSPERAQAAAESIRKDAPDAILELEALDLASLVSIRAAAERLQARHARIDVLINNAGIMAIPYTKTADGFEAQLGTNHFGHFALTNLLLPSIGDRVVTVSSLVHWLGGMDWDDLDGTRNYQRWPRYMQAKLANLLFTRELSKRIGQGRKALAAHPGYASTNLQTVGAKMDQSTFMERFYELGNWLFAQSAAMGALPSLRAALDPTAENGDYYGPAGVFEMAGWPVKVGRSKRARSDADAARLWQLSKERTGVG